MENLVDLDFLRRLSLSDLFLANGFRIDLEEGQSEIILRLFSATETLNEISYRDDFVYPIKSTTSEISDPVLVRSLPSLLFSVCIIFGFRDSDFPDVLGCILGSEDFGDPLPVVFFRNVLDSSDIFYEERDFQFVIEDECVFYIEDASYVLNIGSKRLDFRVNFEGSLDFYNTLNDFYPSIGAHKIEGKVSEDGSFDSSFDDLRGLEDAGFSDTFDDPEDDDLSVDLSEPAESSIKVKSSGVLKEDFIVSTIFRIREFSDFMRVVYGDSDWEYYLFLLQDNSVLVYCFNSVTYEGLIWHKKKHERFEADSMTSHAVIDKFLDAVFFSLEGSYA